LEEEEKDEDEKEEEGIRGMESRRIWNSKEERRR